MKATRIALKELNKEAKQAAKDRLKLVKAQVKALERLAKEREERISEVNRRAESEIQGLARKLNLLGDKIGDVEDLLRRKVSEGDGDSPSSCR